MPEFVIPPHRNEKVPLICMRKSEMTNIHPRQIERQCSVCGEIVGIFPSGQEVLRKYGDEMEIVCLQCSTQLEMDLLLRAPKEFD